MIYKNIKITTTKNDFNGKWSASYTLPGEDETHTGFFASDERTATNYAKRNIDRALASDEPPKITDSASNPLF